METELYVTRHTVTCHIVAISHRHLSQGQLTIMKGGVRDEGGRSQGRGRAESGTREGGVRDEGVFEWRLRTPSISCYQKQIVLGFVNPTLQVQQLVLVPKS